MFFISSLIKYRATQIQPGTIFIVAQLATRPLLHGRDKSKEDLEGLDDG